MSSAAKKLEDDSIADPLNAPSDRELKLSKNFEDPGLDEVLAGLVGSSPEPISLVEEAALAVHELVQEAAAIEPAAETEGFEDLPIPDEALSISEVAEAPVPRPLPQSVNPNPDPLERSLLMQVPPDAVEEPATMLAFEGQLEDNGFSSAMYSMSDRLFELVVCDSSFDEVVEAALRAIMQGLGAQAGSVLELDHAHEDFFFRASLGGSPVEKLQAFRVPLTKGIVGHVAESGQPLLIRDLSQDEKQMRAISLSVGFDAKTCMAAPILVGGQPYGVIELFNRPDGGLFEEKDLAALEGGLRMFAKILEVRFLLAELSRRVG